MKYSIGDTVMWTSQAQGFYKEKVGKIVAIVPAGFRPGKEGFPDLHKGSGCGYARDDDSYVVKVGRKHYWPRVNSLSRMDLED